MDSSWGGGGQLPTLDFALATPTRRPHAKFSRPLSVKGGATIKVVIKLCGTRDCLKIEMYNMDLATTLMCREHIV